MAEVIPTPPSSEFQKLSATMLQYVFDLETEVEQRFHVSHVVASMIVSFVAGVIVALAI